MIADPFRTPYNQIFACIVLKCTAGAVTPAVWSNKVTYSTQNKSKLICVERTALYTENCVFGVFGEY